MLIDRLRCQRWIYDFLNLHRTIETERVGRVVYRPEQVDVPTDEIDIEREAIGAVRRQQYRRSRCEVIRAVVRKDGLTIWAASRSYIFITAQESVVFT